MITKIKQFLNRLNRRDTRLIRNKFKPVLITLLVIGVFFFAKANFAATTQILNDDYANNSLIKKKQDAIKKGNNQESWMYESLGSNTVSGIIALSGEIPDDVLKGKQTSWIPSGMLGQTTQLIASTYNQPASGIQYIAQVKDNFLGKPVYAQGVGYKGLSPLLPLWKTFRNAVYAIFSIIFVGMGIAIMLRIKISPQAVVTIQTAIPKLISSLILVTFSYAIVGLLIDLSYFVQSFVIALLFQGTGINNLSSDLFAQNNGIYGPFVKSITNALSGTIFAPGDNIFLNNLKGLTTMDFIRSVVLISQFAPTWMASLLGILIGAISGLLIGGIPSGGIGALPGAIIGGLLGAAVITLVIEIIIFILIIKFFIGLIKAYFNLILKIITGPLEIAMGALPNSKMGFSSWILDVVANLAVFPICVIYIVLVSLILNQLTQFSTIWTPSLLTVASIQLTPTILVQIIFGLGALMLLPKLPTMIPEFIFQLKPSPWGKAIGETFSSITTPIGKVAQTGGKAGVDYADQRVGDINGTKWQKTVSFANRLLGGKNYRKNVDRDSTTQDDEVL
jgi:hypothetical protein